MIGSYFKIFLRQMMANWAYSAINMLNLAIGLCCFLIISLFVMNEFEYDKHATQLNNTYRVLKYFEGENIEYGAYTPPPLASTIKEEVPKISNIVRYQALGSKSCKSGDSMFYENIYAADSSFFEVFNYQLLAKETDLLGQPFTIVITEKISKKYFDKANAIGEYITIDDKPYKITGIIKNPPKNAHLKFDLLISLVTIHSKSGSKSSENYWRSSCLSTYVVIRNHQKIADVQLDIQKLVDRYTGDFYDLKLKVTLQSLGDIHLKSGFIKFEANNENKGDINTIGIFLLIGILILLISFVNFTNLNIIQSIERSKEIGVRKVFGANKISIRKQFIGESITISFLAYFLSLILINSLLPLFNSYFNRQLSLNQFVSSKFLIFSLAIVILMGLLSAIYQSGVLSKLNPIAVLKGAKKSSSKSILVHKILLVVQFSISIFMILFSVFIYQQVQFITNKDLGYNIENILVLNLHSKDARSKIDLLKNGFALNPSIESVSASLYGNKYQSNGNFNEPGESKKVSLYQNVIDIDFFKTLNVKIIKGRNLTEYRRTDSIVETIVNETAVKAFGWKNPIGKKIAPYFKVVGVIKDYNFLPLIYTEAPMIYFCLPNYFEKLLIKMNPINITQTTDYIKAKWGEVIVDQPIDYYFLDSELLSDYRREITTKNLNILLAIISIFITIVGLIVITTFTINTKSKEIVIKKVLGATNIQIIYFVFKDTLGLLVLSNLIVWPITYFVISNWLNKFAYRIEINLNMFLLTGLFSLILTALAILFQILKATRVKPIEFLKYE